MAVSLNIGDYFSLRAFIQGSLLGAMTLSLLGLATITQKDKTLRNLQENMPSRTVIIENLNYASSYSSTPDINRNTETTQDGETSATAPPSLDTIKKFEGIRAALYPAPIKGLFDRTRSGPLPKISEKGITPFDAYKKPFSATGKPMIAIAVRDFGLNAKESEDILNMLPDNVTLILSSYANTARTWQNKARQNGFETWLNIPAQNHQFKNIDAGSKMIMANAGLKNNQTNIQWLLTQASGYAGVALDTDEILADSEPIEKTFINEFFKRGLGFFELNPNAPLKIETLAITQKQPYIKNQAFLNDISLRSLEKTARENGYAIGVITPYPKSIQALQTWLETLDNKGFTIAPLSAVNGLQTHTE